MEVTLVKKERKKKAPVPTSPRKRPSKAFISKMVEFRGYMTCNEKLLLEGLTVKNLLQRINNRGFDGMIKADTCNKIQKLMKAFVKDVDEMLDND